MPATNDETVSAPPRTCLPDEKRPAPCWWTRFRRRVFIGQLERERLLTDIDALKALAANYRYGNWGKQQFDELLKCARSHAERGDVASGYELLHIAERQSVYGMPEDELEIRAISLQFEIDKKLDKHWRGLASIEMLKAAERRGCDAAETARFCRAAVAEAVGHRNTHDRNSHRKTDQLRMQVIAVGILLFLQVLGFVSVAGWFPFLLPKDPGSRLLLECAALGLLGGTLSCAMFINGFDRTKAFQDMDNAWTISLARASIGCAVSIPVYLIATAKWITIGGSGADPHGIQMLCFLAGLSERWFLHLMPTAPSGSQAEAGDKVKIADTTRTEKGK
jgi:hypothetical protein